MTTFGRYLLEHRVLDRAQLEDATQVMVVFGGRLGTILVEAGLLDADQVERHLAAHLGVAAAPPDRLLRPDPDALRRIDRDVAQRHRVLPLWIEKRRLHAALLDPANPERIDAVAFAVGLPVVPYAICEHRLVRLHEQHYGIRPDSRFTDATLLELAGHVRSGRASRDARWEWGASAPAEARGEPEVDELARWREANGIRALADGEELSDAAAFAALATAPPEWTAAPPAVSPSPRVEAARSATERAGLEADLAMTGDRDAVLPTALRIAASHARAAAVFSVRDGRIHGLLATGGSPSGAIDGVCVPASEPSMLATAAHGSVFYGSPAREGIDALVTRLVSGGEPREAAIVPVSVRGSVVQLLYLDNGPDPLPPSSLVALGTLCDEVSAAWGRLIVESTRQHC